MTASKADWPQIGAIVVNHDGGTPPAVDHLNGRSFVFDGDALAFVDNRLHWGDRDVAVRVFEARPGIYFVDADCGQNPSELALVLDLNDHRMLAVDVLCPAPDVPDSVMERLATRGSQSAVHVTYHHGGTPFPPSAALVGKQFRYRYSDTHLYDHLYLSEKYYAWFCREGPDAGLGDFEECDYFQIAPDLILLCWREKLLPCVGITLEDHHAMRTIGKIAGADSYTGATASSSVGAAITKIADIA